MRGRGLEMEMDLAFRLVSLLVSWFFSLDSGVPVVIQYRTLTLTLTLVCPTHEPDGMLIRLDSFISQAGSN
jgi:hypothetical protein